MASEREGDGDDALVVRMGQGDEEALRELIIRHQDRVYGTVARMIGGAGPDAEDLAQQVFLRIWRAAPTYRARARFTTWLMTVTRNLVFTFCDNRSKRLVVSDVVLDEEGEEVEGGQESVMERNPRDDLSGKELVQAVRLACAHLPKSRDWWYTCENMRKWSFRRSPKYLG